MGKASRIKQQSTREKIAAQREAARRAERRNRMLITGGSTLAVLVIVLAFVIVKVSQGSPSSSGSSTGTPLPASVASQVRDRGSTRTRQYPYTGTSSARAMVWAPRLNPATAGETSESTPNLSTLSACTANTYRCVSPAGGAAPPNALTP